MDERILQAVYQAVDEVNELLPPVRRITKAPESVLFSHSGPLDSLGLLNFIVALESALEDHLGAALILSDKGFNINDNNPFATLQTLVGYLREQVGTVA